MNLCWEKLSSCFVWVCGWVVCMAELKPAPTRHPDPGKMEWAGDRRLYSWQYLAILGNTYWYLAILGDTWQYLVILGDRRLYSWQYLTILGNTWGQEPLLFEILDTAKYLVIPVDKRLYSWQHFAIADSAQTEYCSTFHCLCVCVCVQAWHLTFLTYIKA